jgi:HEAT repeat protein
MAKRFTVWVLVAATLLASVLWLALPTRASYQGKPLRYWTVRLEFPDFETRSSAVTALQTMGESAVDPLLTMLQRKDSSLNQTIFDLTKQSPIPLGVRLARRDRLEAAVALGVLGPAARAAIPALIEACRETNTLVGTKAEAALIRIRQETIQPLVAKLSDFNAANWRHTATMVSDLGSNATPALPVFLEALQHTNYLIRSFSASCLGHLSLASEQVVPALMRCADDRHEAVRERSLFALYQFGQGARAAEARMVQSLQDTNLHVRLCALMALEAILPVQDTNRVLVALGQALHDAVPAIRLAATNLLRQIDPRTVTSSGFRVLGFGSDEAQRDLNSKRKTRNPKLH